MLDFNDAPAVDIDDRLDVTDKEAIRARLLAPDRAAAAVAVSERRACAAASSTSATCRAMRVTAW